MSGMIEGEDHIHLVSRLGFYIQSDCDSCVRWPLEMSIKQPGVVVCVSKPRTQEAEARGIS